MSCQQASRFHSAAATLANTAALAKNTSATRRIASTTLTPVESVAGKPTTPEDSDPYAFTETVAVTPPILFNAQKSRARLSENNKSKRQITAGATINRKANLVAQLNATAAAAGATAATTKAQASLATTTNFNNVTQSQSQPRQPPTLSQLQSHSQSTLPLQSQASPKRATNVCIVRPQQQEKSNVTSLGQQQLAAPPPPLYTHTPSLWQTPLILDTNQKQQQQQTVISLVSPPTSPASLPSPTLPHSAAVTAMVAPIVSPKGGGLPLPPSKFHHTTLAQHLQKVECLKKKKSLPLVCQNNNNYNVESLNKSTVANYNLTQPPPLTVFNTGTAATPPAPAPAEKHSTSTAAAPMDDSDLNEIPVNVIFRKPPVLMAGAGATGQVRQADVKIVMPVTPPTPPMPPLLANLSPQMPASPALSIKSAPAPPAPPSAIQTEQMSSKVANAAPKRQTPAAGAGGKRGNNSKTNNNNNNNNNNNAKVSAMTPPQEQPLEEIAVKSTEHPNRRRNRKPASKRCSVTLNENDSLYPDVPYCLQQHWLHSSGKELALETPLSPSNRREERIAVRKGLLRRQALQLLSTRSLQEMPMRAARQRLQCVQSLLLKYEDHAGQQQAIGIGNRCLVATCRQPTLSMAAHCESHIVNNSTQQLFRPCAAWRMDGTACQAPVFDVLHSLALCTIHSHLRAGLDVGRQPPKQLPVSLPVAVGVASAVTASTAGKRKRKINPNPVTRPQKRPRKQPEISTLPVMSSAVSQRKSSTTSLESIASNSHSSGNSHSQLPYIPPKPAKAPMNMPQQQSIPPALAPLSSDYQQPQQLLVPKFEPGELQQQPPIKFETEQLQFENGLNLLANANIKAEEISQIVAQLTADSGDLHSHHHHNNNNSLHFNNNNNSISYSNNNSSSGCSSFPSFNTAFGNAMGQPITHNMNGTTDLSNTANLLGQDMFGICENSSAYASSEDTGLGGLSESELMGANDADDIALNGAHLLEEHDLVNVFDTLPDDAFNELFQSVQQAECEAMDRALEIADKNLKCLQQTIGGSDSAFLNDFLDVGDDLLADAVINSPNTSGIDASTLFADSSSGGGGGGGGGCSSGSNGVHGCTPDIRGLVQT